MMNIDTGWPWWQQFIDAVVIAIRLGERGSPIAQCRGFSFCCARSTSYTCKNYVSLTEGTNLFNLSVLR